MKKSQIFSQVSWLTSDKFIQTPAQLAQLESNLDRERIAFV
jgi:hypothetical protein